MLPRWVCTTAPVRAGGVLDAWAMDTADAASAERIQKLASRPVVTDLIMRDPASTAAFVGYAIKSATS